MAWLLVQLKLRLLRNGLRSSAQAKAGFIISSALAGILAIGTFAGLAALRGNDASVDLTTVVYTVFALGWLVLPLMTFGLDGTLDPATVALYPLRTRPLAVGLLAASATGAWPLANVIGLLGVTVGLARGPLGLLIAVLAVLLEVVFCITLTRFVTTWLAGLLRSRRGKDLAAFMIIPIFILYETFIQVVPKLTASGELTARSFAGIDSWLRWIPPGLAAHAIQDASAGHAGTALLRLALLAAVTAVLGWLWITALGRALVTADDSTRTSAVHGTALRFGRYGLPGTVAARFWLYQRRDPTGLITWVLTAVIMVVASISTITKPAQYMVGLLLSAVLGSAFTGIYRANSIGSIGPAFDLEAAALAGRRALRAYFTGQDIVVGVMAVTLLTVISFGLAAIARHPVDGFLAMAVDVAGTGAAVGLANMFAVAAPYPAERRVGSPTLRPAEGYRGAAIGSALGTLIGTAVAVTPVLFGVALTSGDPAAIRMPALVLCAGAYGTGLAWAGVSVAAGIAGQRLPEITQIAVRSKL